MKAYRLSVNLKLGLIVFAMSIAIASLAYTNRFVDLLREREQSVIQLWADALAGVAQQAGGNPYQEELFRLDVFLAELEGQGGRADLPPEELEAFRRAVV